MAVQVVSGGSTTPLFHCSTRPLFQLPEGALQPLQGAAGWQLRRGCQSARRTDEVAGWFAGLRVYGFCEFVEGGGWCGRCDEMMIETDSRQLCE